VVELQDATGLVALRGGTIPPSPTVTQPPADGGQAC